MLMANVLGDVKTTDHAAVLVFSNTAVEKNVPFSLNPMSNCLAYQPLPYLEMI
jgi:hypothetical protein